jgi:quinol monooxygenase YgiN
MYGLIVKLTTVAGTRNQMIEVLRGSAANMPGCVSYVIAEDARDENVVWVTEIWETEARHEASLTLPAVKAAAVNARSLVARFEKVATTVPVCDVGAMSASVSATWRPGAPRAPSA